MITKLRNHKDKLYLMLLASLQILINFGTNFYMVHKIGFSGELDVYYISLAIFAFLTSSIGWSISSVLTPILIENKEKKIEGRLFVSIIMIVIPLFILLLLTMKFWTQYLYINYLDKIGMDEILVIQTFSIIAFLFYSLNVLFVSMLQAANRYVIINFFNVLIAVIGFLFIYSTINKYDIYAVAAYQTIVQVSLFLIMGFILIKQIDFKYDKKILSLLWHRMKYIFFGSFYYRTGTIVDKFIASYFSAGMLSLIGFVEKIYGAIITVLNTSIVGPTITKFSILIKENRGEEIKKTLYNYLFMLLIIDMLLFVFIFFFGQNLFLYFFSDKIDVNLINTLSIVLLSLFSIVFGKTLGMLQRSLFMSAKKEKLITIINTVTFTINVLLKIILTYLFGLNGFLVSIITSELLILIIQNFYIKKEVINEYSI